jgi:hypothetical protein
MFLAVLQAVGDPPGVGAAAMLASPPRVAQLSEAPSFGADAAFWGVIGHLYAAARAELIRSGRSLLSCVALVSYLCCTFAEQKHLFIMSNLCMAH